MDFDHRWFVMKKGKGLKSHPSKIRRWALGPRDCASNEDEEEEEDAK
jgi:hypothetical protein